jgi:tyrosine-protein phosphatase non-receptor type 12/18/22
LWFWHPEKQCFEALFNEHAFVSVDSSRVILSEYAGVPGSDYINANYIKGASGSPAYIACQGPLPHTVNDFWRMVVECEVQVIVMACNEEEAGKVIIYLKLSSKLL